MTRWLHDYLGYGNRKPVSNCVVLAIRRFFSPAEEGTGAYTVEHYPGYTGFKAAPADENKDPDEQEEMDES